MHELLSVLRRLRAPDGCPWDREQTHESLRTYLVEEAAEAVDAIHAGDTESIVDELGDVLLQIGFHAVIAEEEGTFQYPAIERAIVDKLVRRHPHVFGNIQVEGAQDVVSNWEGIKREERGGGDEEPQVPNSLPALRRAAELCKVRNWHDSLVTEKIPRDYESDPTCLGDALLALVYVAVRHGIDPELELRDSLERKLQGM
jgi:MazG family protein